MKYQETVYAKIAESDNYFLDQTSVSAWDVITVLVRRGKKPAAINALIDKWLEHVKDHNRTYANDKIGLDNIVSKWRNHLLISPQDVWDMRLTESEYDHAYDLRLAEKGVNAVSR